MGFGFRADFGPVVQVHRTRAVVAFFPGTAGGRAGDESREGGAGGHFPCFDSVPWVVALFPGVVFKDVSPVRALG